MRQKVLIGGLCLTLVLSLVGCGGQQAPVPQQSEDVQQTEPVTETQGQPVEIKQEVDPATPVMASGDANPSMENGDNSSEGDTGEVEPAVEVQLFTDCNETVYATGTVNIRESWSVDSNKLGSLGTGDSVTRTGVSIEGTEADGWSRISLADGSIVYVGSKYLSTTKPVQQKPQTDQNKNQETSNPSSSSGDQQQPLEQPPTQQQNQDNSISENKKRALAQAQAACEARGDGSYAIITESGFVRVIYPEGISGNYGQDGYIGMN